MNYSFFLPILLTVTLLQLTNSELAGISSIDGNINSIRKIIVGRSLIGKWKLSEDSNFRINSKMVMINEQSDRKKRASNMLNFFPISNSLREVEGFFEGNEYGKEATGLYLRLYDGKYEDNLTAILQINLGEGMTGGLREDKGLTLWSNAKQQFVTCLLLREKRVVGKFSVGMKVQIYTTIKADQQLTNSSKIEIQFQSNSFSFYAALQPIGDEYSNLVNAVQACTVLFILGVIFFKPKRTVYNISEWMIMQVVAFVVGANIILLYVSFGKLDTSLSRMAICALINIGTSLFFLRNYENVVLNEFNSKKKGIILTLFLILYFTLVYYFEGSLIFWIYQSFVLLALQINYAYSVGGRGGMAITLVITILVTRIPFIFYRFYFEVLTREPNNPKMLIVFLGINIIMLAFITLQRYFGSRFLIPKQLIPDYYNYYKKEQAEDVLKENCPICTVPLKQDPDGKETAKEVELEDVTSSVSEVPSGVSHHQGEITVDSHRKLVVIMVTPCSHSFHPSCLQDWMDKRLNCPICRTDLPPSEQQRDDSYCC